MFKKITTTLLGIFLIFNFNAMSAQQSDESFVNIPLYSNQVPTYGDQEELLLKKIESAAQKETSDPGKWVCGIVSSMLLITIIGAVTFYYSNHNK